MSRYCDNTELNREAIAHLLRYYITLCVFSCTQTPELQRSTVIAISLVAWILHIYDALFEFLNLAKLGKITNDKL